MIDGKYHSEYKHGKKVVIVDVALIGGMYEVIAMTQDGKPYEEARFEELADAVVEYVQMCEKYGKAELKGKYAELKQAVIEAKHAAEIEVITNPEDGGTCNLDSVAISLPRWNSKLVLQALDEAGCSAFVHAKRYILGGGAEFGQANARTRFARAMKSCLCDKGYDAFVFYMID